MVSYIALFRKTQVVNGEAVATDPPKVEELKETVLAVSGNSSGFQLDPDSFVAESEWTYNSYPEILINL